MRTTLPSLARCVASVSSAERRHALQILTTPIGARPVAGLVLGRDEPVRAAVSFGHVVEVATRLPYGRFDISSLLLKRLQAFRQASRNRAPNGGDAAHGKRIWRASRS